MNKEKIKSFFETLTAKLKTPSAFYFFSIIFIVVVFSIIAFEGNYKTNKETAAKIAYLEELNKLKIEVAVLQEQNKAIQAQLETTQKQLQEAKEEILFFKNQEVILKSKLEKENINRSIVNRLPFTPQALLSNPKTETKIMITYAYSNDDCGKTVDHPEYGITYSGNPTKEYYTIAMGKSYPIGTVVYIPDFHNWPNKGIFVCEDRGSKISDRCIDIYTKNKKDADAFGRKDLKVYILKKGA